ncbi:MAG: aspartate dehydrogenase [Oliverpabstia sp.]|nr:aspartate dehydrogenase [Lachnospiraceae bacterium]MDY5026035.1 aspartate dehydrogenase [Oliverpabstia sp.]
MFGRRKKVVETFDRAEKRPVIRCSICTGEQVAGFQNLKNGKFEEVMVLRSTEDRQGFLEKYGIREDEIEKIW